MTRIAIAHGKGPWLDQIEDPHVVETLNDKGFDAESVVWGEDVSAFDAVLVGSTWDYAEHAARFGQWLHHADDVATLINPLPTMLWSLRKTYLEELQDAGVPCVPTVVKDRFDVQLVNKISADHGWDELILKSVVSAGGVQMARVLADDLESRASQIVDVLGDDQILVQPYVPDVAKYGEWSLMYFAGSYSHAVLKQAAPGEYRVQDDWGGTVEGKQPPAEVRAVADAAIAACPHTHVYARVDVFAGEHAWLNELEMVEPELFHRFDPESITRLVDAIREHLG